MPVRKPFAQASSKSAKSNPGQTKQRTSASESPGKVRCHTPAGTMTCAASPSPVPSGVTSPLTGSSAVPPNSSRRLPRCASQISSEATRCHADDSPAGSRNQISVPVLRTRPSGNVTATPDRQVSRYQPPSGWRSSPSSPAREGTSVIASQDGEDAQHLDVQPDDGDRQAEGCPPRLALREAGSNAAFDIVEVEDEHEHRDDDAQQAGDEAHQTETVEAEAVAEEGQDEVEQADRDEAEHRGDDDLAEPPADLDVEELVGSERAGEGSERAKDGTEDDALVAGRDERDDQLREGTDEQALDGRVGQDEGRADDLLEGVDQREDQATDGTEHRQQVRLARRCGVEGHVADEHPSHRRTQHDGAGRDRGL